MSEGDRRPGRIGRMIGIDNAWTGRGYRWVRAAAGLYLAVHFAHLVPWGAEIFSSAGVLPDAASSPFSAFFPSVLGWIDTPAFVTGLLGFAVLAGLLFGLGVCDRTAALVLWYVLAVLHVRNPLIANPSLPFVGWMLLAHAALPSLPPLWAGARERAGWTFPREIFGAAWILMAVAYSYSGYTKLISPSWVDGTAFRLVLENPLARPSALRQMLLGLPDVVFHLATWGALALELAFAPLALAFGKVSRRLRPWLWLLLLSMHLGLISLIDFADLSLGMVIFHLFTFDPGWIGRGPTATLPAPRRAGSSSPGGRSPGPPTA